eukprot:2805520-Prymnesium_polylepis.1
MTTSNEIEPRRVYTDCALPVCDTPRHAPRRRRPDGRGTDASRLPVIVRRPPALNNIPLAHI